MGCRHNEYNSCPFRLLMELQDALVQWFTWIPKILLGDEVCWILTKSPR